MSPVKRELVALLDKWSDRFENRIADLDDEEFWSEPTADSWKIHRDGSGGDFGLIFTEEAPVTTMGWRLAHIIDLLKEDRCATYLGVEPEASAAEEWIPTSGDQARQMVRDAAAVFRRYIEATDEAALDQPVPRRFNDRELSRHGFILHIIDEVIHHGAEVGLLRDLWRAQQPKDEFVAALLHADRARIDELQREDPDALKRTIAAQPDLMVEAAATARWAAVPLLVELGFPINGSTGRSALHHAAADGNLDLVRLLVERGADTNAKDSQFNARPVMWAQFFDQAGVADYLTKVRTDADGQ